MSRWGLGRFVRISELAQSYISAREAVSYRALYGTSRAINIREIAPHEKSTPGLGHESERSRLLKAIRLNTPTEIKSAVRDYLSSISFKEKSLQQHHIDLMELLSELCRFAANNDLTIEEFSGDMGRLYGRLLDMEPNTLEEWLCSICVSLHENLLNVRNKSTRSFVENAKDYVENHYSNEEVSLDTVCEALGVSNSYFSTIFKKETGKSFIGYLTDYRMERASRLLLETNEKSYIIGKKVGYTDPNYFSYVFKRKFGVSPSKYRTEHNQRGRISIFDN